MSIQDNNYELLKVCNEKREGVTPLCRAMRRWKDDEPTGKTPIGLGDLELLLNTDTTSSLSIY